MKRIITSFVAIIAMVLTMGASKCENKNNNNEGPKDCFSDTGSDKPMFVTMTWDGADRPVEVSGYARDIASGNHVDINEILATQHPYTKILMYISGCKVHVWMQVRNRKAGFAFVRADDGTKNGCRAQEEYVRSLSCEFTTKR